MSHDKSPKEAIEHAKKCLATLQKQITELVELAPEIFDKGQPLNEYLQSFTQIVQEATDKLAKPVFRIATIGTTSSGKSTAVNALIGRRIAPIDSGEMSAGILTFAHHPSRSRLIIETTHDAEKWPSGTKENLSDSQIYDELKKFMQDYHKRKKIDLNLDTTSIRVELPLMPVLRPELLELPENVQFELIDLPGLKSVNDKNLEVIQKIIKEYTFSLVILDYTQTFDKEKSKRLFSELKDIADLLNKRTDLMMFISNKVDERTSDDKPLCETLDKLAEDVSREIDSENTIRTIGAIFILLYHIQCAWGPNNQPLIESHSMRVSSIKKLAECNTCIGVITNSEDERLNWFERTYTRSWKERGEILDEHLRQLLDWANDKCGGKAVWEELRQRIKTCFPQLVILPVVKDIPASTESLIAATKQLADTRKIDTQAELNKKIQETNRELNKLKELVNSEGKAFKERLTNSMDMIQRITPSILKKVGRFADDWSKTDSFFGFWDAWKKSNMTHVQKMQNSLNILGVSEDRRTKILLNIDLSIETDIYENLINPLRQSLKEQKLPTDFTANIISCIGISGVLLQEIGESYGSLRQLFNFPKRVEKGGIFIRFFSSPEEREEARKVVEDMMNKMCEAIAQRAQWKLQSLKPQLQESLEFILKTQKDQIVKKFDKKYHELVKCALYPRQSLLETEIQLPIPFITPPDTWWDWFILEGFPSVDDMANKLLGAVKQAEYKKLWPSIVFYLITKNKEIDKQMQSSISHTRESFEHDFEKQRTRLERHADLEIAKWERVEQHCGKIQPSTENLQLAAGIIINEEE